jgi:hypothetical protein
MTWIVIMCHLLRVVHEGGKENEMMLAAVRREIWGLPILEVMAHPAPVPIRRCGPVKIL